MDNISNQTETAATKTSQQQPQDEVPPSFRWKVQDAANEFLDRRRGYPYKDQSKESSIPSASKKPSKKHIISNTKTKSMKLSNTFDITTCQARLRRDKAPLVRFALDAAATCLLETLYADDDDDDVDDNETINDDKESYGKATTSNLPGIINDISRLQTMRITSIERAVDNKDLNKRKIALARELIEYGENHGRKKKKPDNITKPVVVSSNNETKAEEKLAKISTITTAAGSSNKGEDKGKTKTITSQGTKKFTRNTPASSSTALEARLTSSRAILCTTANVVFKVMTPAFDSHERTEILDVADIPQNPNIGKDIDKQQQQTSDNENTAEAKDDTKNNNEIESKATISTKQNTSDETNENKTSKVSNMGAVIVEAQTLGHRIEAVANNAIRRSDQRSQYRKNNIFYDRSSPTAYTGFRLLKNPFAWTEEEEKKSEEPNEDDKYIKMDIDDIDTFSMDIDGASDTAISPITDAWKNTCLPRLLSIMNTGGGHAIIHDVLWSSRHGRIAELLQIFALKNDRFGPHLIIATSPDVERYAKQFKAVNSHLRLMSMVDEKSLRALTYKGTRLQRRRLREQFSDATGLSDASFHVIITSYANYLTDYLHFCQTPFEIVLVDDGISWMAAAATDPNSELARLWDDGMFSKNDHQMGLAGTFHKKWNFARDDFDEKILKEALIGVTARHRLLTSSSMTSLISDQLEGLFPVEGLVSFVAPQFADAVREEWDRSRIIGDSDSMQHFRKLLTRSMVVHDPDSEKQNLYELSLSALQGKLKACSQSNEPDVPEFITDDTFVADEKVSNSRRAALHWLGSKTNSWLRYELGRSSFRHIFDAMKESGMYGYVCEEIVTASSTTAAGAYGQIAGSSAYKPAVRCGKSFGTEQALRQHHSTFHAPPGTWLCRTCGADCVTSQARTHHERTCGQPLFSNNATNNGPPTAASAGKKGKKRDETRTVGKKKGEATKIYAAVREEKDSDGCIRVPSYRGVWVVPAGKYFVKIANSERLLGDDGSTLFFDNVDDAARKYDAVNRKDDQTGKLEYNFKPDGSRIVYGDKSTSTTTGLGGSAANVIPALSVINIKDLPPDVKPLLRDPRQTSRSGGNSKRHIYAYRGVCRQARKGHDRWQSQISFLGVNHYLGTFDSEWDAAAIYAWAHLILYGEEATKQAQKEGEEAAAAYEQEQRDIAAGKIPDPLLNPKKVVKQPRKKKKEQTAGDTKKKNEGQAMKAKPGRKKQQVNEVAEKQPSTKKANSAVGKEELAKILEKSANKASILSPHSQFANTTDVDMLKHAASRMIAARSSKYCLTDALQPAPIDLDIKPCCPVQDESREVPASGAMLYGIKPSLFGWKIDSILSQHYFCSGSESAKANAALRKEYGKEGRNGQLRSLIQGTTTVLGCATSRMRRAYSNLGLGNPDATLGGPIGSIDCNIGGSSKCCSESAACIRYIPTDSGDFQMCALSTTDVITLNGQRITPEMGNFPLFNEDVCTVGCRVFVFLLPKDA